jgi:hypothetical protein
MPKVATAPLVREDWDFSKCPEDRLEFCRNYEIAREIMRESRAFLKFFKNEKTAHEKKVKGLKKGERIWVDRNKGFDEQGTWHFFLQGAKNANGRSDFSEAVDAPMGFPHEPYLRLKHLITARSYQPFGIGPHFKHWVSVVQEVHYIDGKFGTIGMRQEFDPYFDEINMFKINWSCSPNEIAAELKRWAYSRHPGKFVDRRGKNTVHQELRDDLDALGAWRLIKARGSYKAVTDYTAKYPDINDGEGLFRQPSGWSDAKKRARKILDVWKQALADSGLK